MKNNNILRLVIVGFILLFFAILCFLLYIVISYNLSDTSSNISVTTANNEFKETVEDVVIEYDCKFYKVLFLLDHYLLYLFQFHMMKALY